MAASAERSDISVAVAEENIGLTTTRRPILSKMLPHIECLLSSSFVFFIYLFYIFFNES